MYKNIITSFLEKQYASNVYEKEVYTSERALEKKISPGHWSIQCDRIIAGETIKYWFEIRTKYLKYNIAFVYYPATKISSWVYVSYDGLHHVPNFTSVLSSLNINPINFTS